MRAAILPLVLVVVAAAGCGKGTGGGAGGASSAVPPTASNVAPLAPVSTVAATTAAPPVDFKGPSSFAPIVKAADDSVVTIYTLGEEEEASPFTRRTRVRQMQGLGTGFIVQKDGVILTNNHVIEAADVITVSLSDSRQFPGRIVGRDKSTDMAVVKIDAKGDLPTLPLGDSDAIDVGDWVVAIGNPYGLSHTVSVGIVSAKGRTRDEVPLGDPTGYYNFLQTDASINPGNSGGPLLNLKGEVVGINTAIKSGGAQGIGFAIPINMVKQLLPMLMRDGHVTRSALGVRIRDLRELSDDERAALHITDDKGNPLVKSGAVVEDVSSNGPADKAGIRPGDIIIAFEGQNIESRTQLQWVASTFGVGKTATVKVARDGKSFDVKVTLTELQLGGAPPAPRAPHPLPPGFGPP